MIKHNYLGHCQPVEDSKNYHPPPSISQNSQLKVSSDYSSCLHENIISKMTQYSNSSEKQQPERKMFTLPQYEEDIEYWNTNCPAKCKRIKRLLKATVDNPFAGIGKPELTKYLDYQGNKVFSRRIDEEHRLTYTVTEDQINFLTARYHYTKK